MLKKCTFQQWFLWKSYCNGGGKGVIMRTSGPTSDMPMVSANHNIIGATQVRSLFITDKTRKLNLRNFKINIVKDQIFTERRLRSSWLTFEMSVF